MVTIKPIPGTISRTNHQVGLPLYFNWILVEYIGIIDSQPGLPAFWNNFQ